MTLPPIPDSIYKLFLLAGVFFLGYGYLEDNRSNEKYFSQVDLYKASIDSLDIELMKIDHQEKKLTETAKILAQKNNIKNPITQKDSLIVFEQILSGKNVLVSVSDSLSRLWNDYKESRFKLSLLNKQLDKKKEALNDAKIEYSVIMETNSWIARIGGVSLLIGLFGMMWIQLIQDELLKRQLQDKPKIYKYCQSCGKKFSSIRPTSKNTDGTNNNAFCRACYDNGQFTEPELAPEEFDKIAMEEINKRKTWLGKKLLALRFKTLERWNTDDYF